MKTLPALVAFAILGAIAALTTDAKPAPAHEITLAPVYIHGGADVTLDDVVIVGELHGSVSK